MDSFRKIDVDKYDEDVLLEEELIDIDPRSSTELAGIAKQKANDVRGLIGRCVGALPAACSLVFSAHTNSVPIHHSRGDARGALAMILSDPPFGEANAEAKVSGLGWQGVAGTEPRHVVPPEHDAHVTAGHHQHDKIVRRRLTRQVAVAR